MIFVDTSAWFAFFSPEDASYTAASAARNSMTEMLVTTNFVIDELLTLMKARGAAARAFECGSLLLEGDVARVEWVTESDFDEAWKIFRTYQDKDWSFTDCTSLVVMRRLGITTAFAFDDHFRQFGSVTVVP